MIRKNKIHIFYTLPEVKLREIIQKSTSLAQVFDYLDLCKTGPQYRVLKQRIEELEIDTSHFVKRIINGRCEKRPIEFYLVEKPNGSCSTHGLKLRLIQEGLLENKCYECGNNGNWNNKKLSLQLEHINGIRNDNRLENLRILCPNCHSQTETYSGKKHKQHHFCKSCGEPRKVKKAKICAECRNKEIKKYSHIFREIISWPNKETLEKLVWTKPMQHLAKDLNCSPNGIKSHCKRIGIKIPPRAYWLRISSGYSHEESLVSQAKIRKPKVYFSQEQINEIKQMLKQKISCRKIGRKFGVAHTTIIAIKNDKTKIYKEIAEHTN